jgi:hypothetical protein
MLNDLVRQTTSGDVTPPIEELVEQTRLVLRVGILWLDGKLDPSVIRLLMELATIESDRMDRREELAFKP